MPEVTKKRQSFMLQLMDLFLQLGLSAGVAEEVATEVLKNSDFETPAETIRTMILDSLRKRDAQAAEKLAKRFDYVGQQLEDTRRTEVEPGGEIYDKQAINELLEADEITAAELFFMEGYEGRSWRRKSEHFDTGSTELSREDYYED